MVSYGIYLEDLKLGYKYNNKFGYRTFEEEAKAFNAPVHCLSYQGEGVLRELEENGVYRPVADKCREANKLWYAQCKMTYGYIPIWVFNPLQFGDEPQGTWDPEWFVDGSLWRSFLEVSAVGTEEINKRILMEIVVNSSELKRDPTLDYGFISIIEEIRPEQVVGTYKLVYRTKHETQDWFYPTIYPNKNNKESATFKFVTNFKEDDD